MSSLRELQRDFLAAVRQPAQAEACAARLAPGGLPPQRRLQIYQNNHRISLTEALAACFPMVERLVGGEFFAAMARRFIDLTPPRSGHLLVFGQDFPRFLAAQPELASLAWIADVATLEWLRQEAFHAPDAPRFAVARLARVPESSQESLRFGLHPSVRLFRSPFPVLSIWETNQVDTEPRTIDVDSGGESVLVWRSDEGIEVAALGAGAAAMLRAVKAGDPFVQACEAALAAQADFDPGAALASLCCDGVISTASWQTTNHSQTGTEA